MGDAIPRRRRRSLAVVLVATVAVLGAPAAAQAGPGDGPGGPILVVVDPGDPFGRYYAEILRAEGLTEFAVTGPRRAERADARRVTRSSCSRRATRRRAQVALLSDWVQRRRQPRGHAPGPGTRPRCSGWAATAGDAGRGLRRRGHGRAAGRRDHRGRRCSSTASADVWSGGGAAHRGDAVRAMPSRPTASPAVTLRIRGDSRRSGRRVHLRPGPLGRRDAPGQHRLGGAEARDGERDGADPLARPLLKPPDWVDFDRDPDPAGRRAAASAREPRSRAMNLDRTPLPRLWYLPRGEKAAVVLTGDDHGNGGTAGQFDAFEAASPPGCSVADWECVRSTSYLYPGTPLSDAQARGLPGERVRARAPPVDRAARTTRRSRSRTLDGRGSRRSRRIGPSLRPPRTSRSHCVTWSDWAGEPLAERAHGIHFDTNYYYFPATWVRDRPGLFTGSGMPMRFADADGSLIDVYQATTQLTDETLLDPPGQRGAAAGRHAAALLDAALGAEGFHGVFTANMHTDDAVHQGADAIVAEALARDVPVVSERADARLAGRPQRDRGSPGSRPSARRRALHARARAGRAGPAGDGPRAVGGRRAGGADAQRRGGGDPARHGQGRRRTRCSTASPATTSRRTRRPCRDAHASAAEHGRRAGLARPGYRGAPQGAPCARQRDAA